MSTSDVSYVVNDRFKVIRKLGIGAQGKVYKVEDLKDAGKIKALKEVKVTSNEDLEHVKREVDILQKLDSPYILKYLDYNHDIRNGFIYILTEIYEDGTLEKIITRNRESKKFLEIENILIWSLQLLRGIDYLHSKSVIHRDIKPQNIFLHRYNLVLGDLGLAKDSALISAKSITKGIGTISFMAPEIFEEKPYDQKIDIWSFGCVVYEMIKLEKLFEGTFMQITTAINNFQSENFKLDNVPEIFQTILVKSVAKLPENRSSAKELIDYLIHHMSNKPTQDSIVIESVKAEEEFWDLCDEEREHYNSLFDQLTSNSQYLSGDKAKEFFKKSELDDEILAKFWNLVDFNKDGQLDKKEFGIACFLIKKVITEGQNVLPSSLPSYLFDEESNVDLSKLSLVSSIGRINSNKKTQDFNAIIITGCNKKIKFYDMISGKFVNELEGHKKDVTSVKIVSDEILASSSHDKTIKLWNMQKGELLRTLEGHQWSVLNLDSIETESTKLLASSSLSEIKLWNVDSGECIKTLIEYASGILSIRILNEETLASSDVDGLIKIWNITSKKCVSTIEAHKGMLSPYSVKCVQHIKDEIIASASKDKKIKIWNYKTGKCIDTLEGVFSAHAATVRCLTHVMHDVLASGSSDRTIKLWNLKTSKCVKTLKGHTDKVTCIKTDGINLISGSDDGNIKVWKIITGECITTINNGHPVSSLQLLI